MQDGAATRQPDRKPVHVGLSFVNANNSHLDSRTLGLLQNVIKSPFLIRCTVLVHGHGKPLGAARRSILRVGSRGRPKLTIPPTPD